MKKCARKKVWLHFLKISKYTFLNIWKSGYTKKLSWVFLRFVSIPFLIFEKEDKQKIVPDFFKTCKYTFCNIWKRGQEKNWRKLFFEICKYTFFNIWESRHAKKLFYVFWRFVNIFFSLFEKENKQKILVRFLRFVVHFL